MYDALDVLLRDLLEGENEQVNTLECLWDFSHQEADVLDGTFETVPYAGEGD